jgi:hypothetical protein
VDLGLLLSLLAGARGSATKFAPAEFSKSGGDKQALVLVCFSYRNDFSLLAISLDSLRRSCAHLDFDYVLVSDRKAPFTQRQLSFLEKKLGRAVKHETTPFFHGRRGVRVFLNELAIFQRLASVLSPGTWITKIDSDLLFLNPEYFEFLRLNRENDHVFQDVQTTLPEPARSWPSYSQGGCYSFNAGLFNSARQHSAAYSFLAAFWEFAKKGKIFGYCNLAEDFLVYYFLSRFARFPLRTTFFVPCPFRRQPGSIEKPRFASVMHFERCSHEMEKYYADFVLRMPVRVIG